jgi:hypothetical protein
MRGIVFEFDPWRGGFCLRFADSGRGKHRSAFGALISIHFDAQDRIVAIKSDFGYGGIPLRGIHQTGFCPKGEFPVKGRQLRVGAFQLRQNEEELEIWFSTGNQLPRDHWTDQRDAESGVSGPYCGWRCWPDGDPVVCRSCSRVSSHSRGVSYYLDTAVPG